MGIFFDKPEPLFSAQQQNRITRKKQTAEKQLDTLTTLILDIHDFYHEFVSHLKRGQLSLINYFANLPVEKISNILDSFEVLKRLNLLYRSEYRDIEFNTVDMIIYFGPLLAGIIYGKSPSIDRKDLQKFQRKFNRIFLDNYSGALKTYNEYAFKNINKLEQIKKRVDALQYKGNPNRDHDKRYVKNRN